MAKREKTPCASLPQLPNVSTATGMHDHPSAWHLASLAACFLVSAAKAAAPSLMLASFRVTGVRGEVTVTSKAAGLALSHPSLGTRRLAFSSQSGQVRISNLFWLFMSIVCVDMKFIVQ